jgi:flap endonuclease-1
MMEDLQLNEEEFVDMCILCGCDYASKIEGIGPVKAYKFIKEFHSIENILEFCRNENEKEGKIKYVLPKEEDFSFEEARELFKNPLVTDDYELKWEKNIDEEALRKFLCEEKGFAETRVEGAVKKLKSNKGTQARL